MLVIGGPFFVEVLLVVELKEKNSPWLLEKPYLTKVLLPNDFARESAAMN